MAFYLCLIKLGNFVNAEIYGKPAQAIDRALQTLAVWVRFRSIISTSIFNPRNPKKTKSKLFSKTAIYGQPSHVIDRALQTLAGWVRSRAIISTLIFNPR